MNALLCGSFDDDERARWLNALRAVLPDVAWRLDGEPFDRAAVELAVVANPSPGRLQGLPRLRLIQSLWAGVDRLLADPTLPAGVPIARMVDPMMNEAMAQTALWATLSLHRGFFAYARRQRAGVWQQHAQRRAEAVAVTVLGRGQMGGAVARRLADNGYEVTGWSRSAGGPLAPLLARSAVVLNLLPLTDATRGFLNARFFAALPAGAGVVNLARGAHVVDDDLLAALDAGPVGDAVLDVFNAEPLPPGHRYWSHPRVTLLPHAAALTDVDSAATVVADNVRALRAGKPVSHLVDRARGY